MATDPFRLRVLKGLTTAIEATELLDGSTLTGKVFRGRGQFGAGDPIPMVSILEAPAALDQTPAPEGSTYSSGEWELLIQGWTKDDKTHPTDPAHGLMAAVKKTLAAERKKTTPPIDNALGMTGMVTNIRISPGVVRPPDEVSDKAYFWLSLFLSIVEDLDDPYG